MRVKSDPLGMLSSSLTRLNFFDGMFLRAELLRREQSGIRSLVFHSNLADGGGIAFGLDAAVQGDTVSVSPGLAIDGEGRVLLLEEHAEASLSDLLGTGTALKVPGGPGRFEPCVDVVPPSRTVVAGATTFYAIVLRHRVSACGWEEVRGRACEDACDASMERPYLVESARIRLCPVAIETKLPASQAVVLADRHLRSRVASAFYADEQADFNQIVSAAGLRSTTWCRGATAPTGICGSDVPVALLAMRAGAVLFVDPWIVRRERMETPPRRYWAGRVRMRSWDVYLAQVLQFQCQLAEALGGNDGDPTTPVDPCADAHDVLGETITVIEALRKGITEVELKVPRMLHRDVLLEGEGETGEEETGGVGEVHPLAMRLATIGGVDRLAALRDRLSSVLKPGGRARRILLDGGIVEAPPAGWLPVDPKASQPLTAQVADLLGPGVDLRFCAIRADQAAGEFESCQHLDRISLLRGIDDPARREQVDILVPDGDIGGTVPTLLMEVDLAVSPRPVRVREELAAEATINRVQIPLKGVGKLDGGRGLSLYGAFAGGLPNRRTASAASGFVADSIRGDRVTGTVNFGDRTVDEALIHSVAAAARNRFARLARSAETGRGFFMWVELTLDRDPRALGQGERGVCAFDFRAVNPSAPDRVFSVVADGEYRVKAVEADGSVVVAVKGLATRVDEAGSHGPDPYDLTFTIDSASGSVRITGDAELAAEWAGSPVTAKAELNVNFSLGALGRQSDDAAQPGNQYHDRALAALTVFEAAQGGFAKDASEKLFGARKGSSTLTTPHDWVLFRRRVRYDCGTAIAPPPVKDGQVDVWHVIADGRGHGTDVIAALREGDFKHSWRRVTTARFVGETAQLRTSAADLRSAWQSSGVGGGNLVLFGGYAATGAFAQPSAVDRVRNLVDGLKPAAVFDGDPATDLVALGQPPSEFVHSGADAAVFLVSLHEVKVEAICAQVFKVANSTDQDSWDAINKPDERAVVGLIGEQRVFPLGVVKRTDQGTFELDQAIIDGLAGEEGVPAVVWVPAELGISEEEAVAFTIDGLAGAAPVSEARAIVREPFRFPREPCPMWLFVRPTIDR